MFSYPKVVPKLTEDVSLKRARTEEGSIKTASEVLGKVDDPAWDGTSPEATVISLLKGICDKTAPPTPIAPIITKFYIFNNATQTIVADTPTAATPGTQISISNPQMYAVLDHSSLNTILFRSQKGNTGSYTFVNGGYYFKLNAYANLKAIIQLSTGQELVINDPTSDSTQTECGLVGFTLDLQ